MTDLEQEQILALSEGIMAVLNGKQSTQALVALAHVAGLIIGAQSENAEETRHQCKRFSKSLLDQALILNEGFCEQPDLKKGIH